MIDATLSEEGKIDQARKTYKRRDKDGTVSSLKAW